MEYKKLNDYKLPNNIEEYLNNDSEENKFLELFQATEDDVDLKTDLKIEEIILVNKIFINSKFLKSKIDDDIYGEFLNNYLRLKVSLDRKSRGEFVDINRKDRFEQNLGRFANFKNLMDVKQ